MTEAYAIKGPDGKIDFVEIDADLETVWYEFIKSVEGRIPTSGSLVKDIEYWKNEGYTCVPVTVSEKGEAELLHLAVCKAVVSLNNSDSIKASEILRQALVDFADNKPLKKIRVKKEDLEEISDQAKQGLFAKHECPAVYACASIVNECDAYLSRGQG